MRAFVQLKQAMLAHKELFEKLNVLEKDVKKNTVIVAEVTDPALTRSEVSLAQVNLINVIQDGEISVLARVRYRQPLVQARLVFDNLVTKLLCDPFEIVRNAATGALRNLLIFGNQDLSDKLVENDIMTPLLNSLEKV